MRQILHSLSWVIPLALLPLMFVTVLSQNTVPGDLLYGYKRGFEGVILAGASVHPTTRAIFQSNLADRRFTEVERVIVANQDYSGLSEFIFTVAKASEQVHKVEDEQTKEQLRADLRASIDTYKQKFEELKTTHEAEASLVQQPTITSIPQPTNTQSPRPTNTPIPSPTSRLGQPTPTAGGPTNTPVPLPTNTPTPTVGLGQPTPTPTRIPARTPTPLPTSLPPSGQAGQATPTPGGGSGPTPPSTNCESLPTPAQRDQCVIDALDRIRRVTGTTATPIDIGCTNPTGNPGEERIECTGVSCNGGAGGLMNTQVCGNGRWDTLLNHCDARCASSSSTPTPLPTSLPPSGQAGQATPTPACTPWDFGNCSMPGDRFCSNYQSGQFCNWTQEKFEICKQRCNPPTPTPTIVQTQPVATPTPACFLGGWDSQNCSQAGQATCTDYGRAEYCGWTPSAWESCSSRCSQVQGAADVQVQPKNLFGAIVDWLTTPSIRTKIEGLTN